MCSNKTADAMMLMRIRTRGCSARRGRKSLIYLANTPPDCIEEALQPYRGLVGRVKVPTMLVVVDRQSEQVDRHAAWHGTERTEPSR